MVLHCFDHLCSSQKSHEMLQGLAVLPWWSSPTPPRSSRQSDPLVQQITEGSRPSPLQSQGHARCSRSLGPGQAPGTQGSDAAPAGPGGARPLLRSPPALPNGHCPCPFGAQSPCFLTVPPAVPRPADSSARWGGRPINWGHHWALPRGFCSQPPAPRPSKRLRSARGWEPAEPRAATAPGAHAAQVLHGTKRKRKKCLVPSSVFPVGQSGRRADRHA